MSKGRLNHIESIRAFAALAVAIFHFTNHYNIDGFLIPEEGERGIFIYGAQGVEMFYLISGFIIPYSLYRSRYRIKHYFHYLTKRLSRLLPPYYITIGLILFSGFLFAKFLWGSPYNVQWRNVAANMFFAVDFINAIPDLLVHFPDNGWINEIFETLKVEFQFYILIGLVFPLINRNNLILIGFSVLLLLLGIYTPKMNTVLVNSPYFLLGIAAFYIFEKGWKWEYITIIVLCLLTLWQFYVWQDLIIAIIAFALVTWLPVNFKFLAFTGKISYSYYLIHGLVGGNFLFFTRNTELYSTSPYLMVIIALILSWIGAFLMYFCIEKPSMLISKKIKYK